MQLIDESKAIVFNDPVDYNEENETFGSDEDSVSDNDQYEFGGGRIFKELSIKLGTSAIPRFSCANHKCNIAVRKAIRQHPALTVVLKKLSSYAGKILIHLRTKR